MLSKKLDNYRIILASRSPRRKQMLSELGMKFDTIIKEFTETYPADLSGREIAELLSSEKAGLFKQDISDNEIVITADTIVWCNNKVLGKPVDKNDARRMIRALSANTHQVITGVTLLSKYKEKTFSETTSVTFLELSDEEIGYYIEKYKPFDKAGAYGIQEWIGLAACSRIEGSYFNVVGLPVHRLYRELMDFIL
jgi:septum formation protein